MPLTFGTVKKIVAKYAGQGGKCPTADDVDLFVLQVLQKLMYSGSNGNLKKFCFNAVNGCFTIPYELDVPLKVKLDGTIGTVWGKWFEWYNYSNLDGGSPAEQVIQEEVNLFPTVQDLPANGSQVGVIGTVNEAEDAYIIIQGTDRGGREVFSTHEGKQVTGEHLRIKNSELRFTHTFFKVIKNVVKVKTKGYVQLAWIEPKSGAQGFLSTYGPNEEIPAYRRFRIRNSCGPSVKISVIGRIRLKENYSEQDIVPFDNLEALTLAAQSINSDFNFDSNTAAAKQNSMQASIDKENEYKRVQNGTPIEVFLGTSPGLIKNIV